MDKELIVVKGKVIEQQRSYSPEIGKDIGYEAAAKMIKRHFDNNPEDVVGHFIGKNSIEQILAQPGCVGVRIFNGLNNLGIKQLILVGVDENGNNILHVNDVSANGSSIRKSAKIVSEAKICPPYCGGATGTSDDSGW